MLVLWIAAVFYIAMLSAVTWLAFRRGGQDERMAMTAFLAMALASDVASYLGSRWRAGLEWGVLSCDVGLTIALLLLVHRSRRFWPLWAAASALVGALTHGVRWISPSLSREVYASIQPFWAFPILIAIAVGSWRREQQTLSL